MLPRSFTALLLAAILCAHSAQALRGEEPAEPGIVVDAIGLADLTDGKPLADANREALTDALRNAVIQARVDVRTLTVVANARLRESVVRTAADGQVRGVEVLSAGPVEGADPPLYRVHVRATVVPVPRREADAAPVVALGVTGSVDDDLLSAVTRRLEESLLLHGVSVADEEGDLEVAVTLSVLDAGGAAWTTVGWQVSGLGSGGPVARGHRRTSLQLRGDSEWWSGVGLAVAVDVHRAHGRLPRRPESAPETPVGDAASPDAEAPSDAEAPEEDAG